MLQIRKGCPPIEAGINYGRGIDATEAQECSELHLTESASGQPTAAINGEIFTENFIYDIYIYIYISRTLIGRPF